jgi:hypothetical protein
VALQRFLLAALSLAIAGAGSAVIAQQPAPAVWIGIGFTLEKDSGIRVTNLPYRSPAERAGVLVNDLIVALDGHELRGETTEIEKYFRESIANHRAGDELTLRVMRDKVLEFKVPVEDRPAGIGTTKHSVSFDETERAFPKVTRSEEQLAAALIAELNLGEGYAGLRRHLSHLSDTGDQFRLSRLAYIQHEPFQLRTVAGGTLDRVAAAVSQKQPSLPLHLAVDWLDAPVSAAPPLKTGLTLEQHIEQLVRLLAAVRSKREDAFAHLTPEERQYLEKGSNDFFLTVSELIDVQQDKDNAKWLRNLRFLELAARVDTRKLFEGAALLWRAAEDEYLDDLESALRKAWLAAGKPEGLFITRDSPAGKILAGGSGTTWYSDDAAIVLDLGGKDFYTNNAGSPRGDKMPGALLIDFAGDDAYEATFNWTQAAANMGHGLMVDRNGNDQYLGLEWAQGAAVLGAALFLDESGNDTYRADQYAQAVAAWGIAVHMDYEGDDVFESRLLSQGVAMPGGAGWLLNGHGNDKYYSKGKHPTGYGDPGIFDSWSQGCGLGFRGLESGGIALFYDGSGADRYEAGNFSQGGGYYFGIGLLRDGGNESDTYIGSRYNQGFAAHQAVGYFEELGGNDFYTARHAVAQGISWDESVVAFIDRTGDDVYEGGASFSQGASAHSGFTLFLDLAGRNRFVYPQAQGFAGPNDYHGGKSFSLFVIPDEKTPGVRVHGEHGLFVPLKDNSRELRKLRE